MRVAVDPPGRTAQPADRGAFVDHQPRPQPLSHNENITRTIADAPPLVTICRSALERCGYVGRDGWRYGEAGPFCVWHVIGCEWTMREWALREGWGGRPLSQETASGILIGALGVLQAHYGR